jgi:hypothetical protein
MPRTPTDRSLLEAALVRFGHRLHEITVKISKFKQRIGGPAARVSKMVSTGTSGKWGRFTMKLARTLALAILAVTQFSHAAAPQADSEKGRGKLEGTWELVSYKYVEGAPFRDVIKDQRVIKLITGNHFIWVSYDVRKKKPTSVGGGRYSLDADTYTEELDFGDKRSGGLLGKPQSFKATIEGDRWLHSGVLSNGLKIEEIWRRVH